MFSYVSELVEEGFIDEGLSLVPNIRKYMSERATITATIIANIMMDFLKRVFFSATFGSLFSESALSIFSDSLSEF